MLSSDCEMKTLIPRGVSHKNQNHPGWLVPPSREATAGKLGRLGTDVKESRWNLPTMRVAAAVMGAACDRVNDNARLFAALCRIHARARRQSVDPAGEIPRDPLLAAAEFFDPTRNWHRSPDMVFATWRKRL